MLVKFRYFDEHLQEIVRIFKNWSRTRKSYQALVKAKFCFKIFYRVRYKCRKQHYYSLSYLQVILELSEQHCTVADPENSGVKCLFSKTGKKNQNVFLHHMLL